MAVLPRTCAKQWLSAGRRKLKCLLLGGERFLNGGQDKSKSDMNLVEIALIANSLIGAFVAGGYVMPAWDDDHSFWARFKLALFAITIIVFGASLLLVMIPVIIWAGLVRIWRELMIKSWISLWLGKWDNLPDERIQGFINGWNYYKDKGRIGRRWMIEVAKRNRIVLP